MIQISRRTYTLGTRGVRISFAEPGGPPVCVGHSIRRQLPGMKTRHILKLIHRGHYDACFLAPHALKQPSCITDT